MRLMTFDDSRGVPRAAYGWRVHGAFLIGLEKFAGKEILIAPFAVFCHGNRRTSCLTKKT
jgi:hypothetical protein